MRNAPHLLTGIVLKLWYNSPRCGPALYHSPQRMAARRQDRETQ